MALNRLADGAAWLGRMRREHMSQRVTYSRGTASATYLPATPGRTTFELDDGGGGIVRVDSSDWLIGKCDLKLDEISIEPARGDRITDTDGIVYEVLPFGSNPEWRWADEYHVDYRIHSKRVDEATT